MSGAMPPSTTCAAPGSALQTSQRVWGFRSRAHSGGRSRHGAAYSPASIECARRGRAEAANSPALSSGGPTVFRRNPHPTSPGEPPVSPHKGADRLASEPYAGCEHSKCPPLNGATRCAKHLIALLERPEMNKPVADHPMPLSGVKVLELGSLIAGPYASALLAQFGADVIKVEPPTEGDPLRK